MSKKTYLQPEALEPRLAMTGAVTASLNAGVLAITGTSDADTITLNYDATQVTIAELNQSFVLKNIAAIDVFTGDGNDIIQLHYVGPKKPKWIGVAVAIHAEGGNDELIDSPGNTYFLSGLQDVLTFSRKGAARLDGAKLTWFDNNIADAAIRTAVKAAYADKVLARNDMLTLFDTAAADDIVCTCEFVSLQKIVNNKPLFRKLDDVYTLSGYVVNGTVANEFFQQDTLGNLAVGSTGEHLEQLVDKWFLGKDHPDSTDIDTSEVYEYRTASGTLFVDGVRYTDIRQGALGDCYLLGGWASIAVHSSKPITNMFVVNGDGTYTVRFYNGAKAYYITVDSQLPVDQSGRLVYASFGNPYDASNNELWVPLAEKAYAQLAEFDWLDTDGGAVNAYAAINAGWPADAVAQTTGKNVVDLLALVNSADLIKSFATHHTVTFITPNAPPLSDVVGNHVYAMVGYNARSRELVLFNPWGLDSGGAPGILTLTWNEIVQNFYSWDYGPKV